MAPRALPALVEARNRLRLDEMNLRVAARTRTTICDINTRAVLVT